MKKIEVIIDMSDLNIIKSILMKEGVGRMTVCEVKTFNPELAHDETYRGNKYTIDLFTKLKVELVLPDDLSEKIIPSIIKSIDTLSVAGERLATSAVDEVIYLHKQANVFKRLDAIPSSAF